MKSKKLSQSQHPKRVIQCINIVTSFYAHIHNMYKYHNLKYIYIYIYIYLILLSYLLFLKFK